MSGNFGIRTDLAVESKEKYEKDNVEIKGVAIQEKYEEALDLNTTVVRIQTEQGAKAMEKSKGTYITMEAPNLIVPDEDYHRGISQVLAHHLKELLHLEKEKSILVVGLGNREITPDALGPLVIKNLFVTRHLKGWKEVEGCPVVAALAPGVMAQTGMETGEIVEGIVKKIHPDALVVIDALAAKSSERLNRTIQISNTGIAPGSGVGNHRNEITEKTMGIPVIAIGVPTVISIPSLACDIMEAFCASQGEGMEDIFCSWPEKEKYHFLGEILDEKLWELFVTPKEIDEAVKRISYTLSEGINQFVAGRIF